jgi:hypothetical protein
MSHQCLFRKSFFPPFRFLLTASPLLGISLSKLSMDLLDEAAAEPVNPGRAATGPLFVDASSLFWRILVGTVFSFC